jgi:Ca2+-binding EF-hand superfamily protein
MPPKGGSPNSSKKNLSPGSARRGGRGGLRRQASGRGLGGRKGLHSSGKKDSSKYKYEKKRSAEDLLKGKKSTGINEKNALSNSSNKKGKKSTSFVKLKRMLPCFSPDVTYELDQEAQNSCDLLGFRPEDIIKIKIRFDDIDIDQTGEIDYNEFLDDVGETRSPFVDAVFRLVDVNGNGLLDFSEYVRVFCLYCTYSKEEILKFTFECFDADGSGAIDEEEFMLLAKTVSNTPMFPANFGKALEEFDTDGDGLIDMDEFRILDRRYPMVLFPAFRLQDNLQRGSLSAKRWKQILQHRELRRIYNEYRKTHDGQLPPLRCKQKFQTQFLFCIYKNPYEWYLKSLDDGDIGPGSPSLKTPPPKKKIKKKKKDKKRKS